MSVLPQRAVFLPERADVVIIGGGIIGCSAAYYLAKQGISVALCEKGQIAGEQSSRNWGYVRQQGRDEAEMPTIMESLRLWRGLSEDIGYDVGYRQTGVVYLADTEKDLAAYEQWLPIAQQYQLDTRLLSAKEVADRYPDSPGRWAGGLETPSDGRAEPAVAAPAIADAAARAGAHIMTRCAVRGIDISGGKTTGVVTEQGIIKTQAVVCAGGAWSSMFCRSLGIDFPQLKFRSSAFRTNPAPALTEGAIWTSKVALRRRNDGGYTVANGRYGEHELVPDSLRLGAKFLGLYRAEREKLRFLFTRRFADEWLTPKRWDLGKPSPFEQNRMLDPSPNTDMLRETFADLKSLFPALKETQMVESWAGLIDITPDMVPVIDSIPSLPGFYLASGFSGHGFGIGPGAGKVIAELVTNVAPTIDRSGFSLSRFH